MIYVIIGCSHSGKSSFTRNTFIRGRESQLKHYLMPVTCLDDCFLIGRYDTGKRRRDGTDSIERKQIGNFANQIIELNSIDDKKDIVLEGMRCVSRPMMNKLVENGLDVKIIWISISPEKSKERTDLWGGKIDMKTAKMHFTQSRNFCYDYAGVVPIVMIDTTELADFSNFSMNNLCGCKKLAIVSKLDNIFLSGDKNCTRCLW